VDVADYPPPGCEGICHMICFRSRCAPERLTLSLTVLALAVQALVSAGCGPGGPEIASVTGRVTLDGQPLANATVVFIPENGRPAGASTDANGKYELNFTQGRRGAIPGKNTIRVTTQRDPYQDNNGKNVPGSKETIPPQYNTASTLSFTVEPKKKNVADFDLKSGG
jgi:hypothetical protein